MRLALDQMPVRTVLTGTFLLSALPIALVIAWPGRLNMVLPTAPYVLFHNITEFFSIMVSLSIFGIGWFTFERSEDRHSLLLSASFLAIGLLDFMHTLSNVAMPSFITPNTSNKSTQFWVAARLFQGIALLACAFAYSGKFGAWLSKRSLLAAALLIPGLVFAGIIFFPEFVPDTFVKDAGQTPFKKISEYFGAALLFAAAVAYWRTTSKTGDRVLIYYQTALIVGVFGEINFAVYTKVFDTYNILGHVYKTVAFFLIYRGIFIASVREPYRKLTEVSVSRDELGREIEERKKRELDVRSMALFPEENPNPVIRGLDDGTILFANQPARAVLEGMGWRRGEPLPSALLQHLKKSLADSGRFEFELSCPGNRFYSFVTAPIPGAGYANLYGKDITERKLAEDDLRKANDALEIRVRERTKELSDLAETLDRRVRERTEEIQMVNKSLEDSRAAALNLMEDALEARKLSEAANAEMRREVDVRRQAEQALLAGNEELTRLNNAMGGRELRMIELKKEINELCKLAGMPPRYNIDFLKEQP